EHTDPPPSQESINHSFSEGAKALTSQPTQTFGPKGFLYVQQRELAATTSKDSAISILGSDDATTCHIVVLRHTGSGATCLAHCDGSDTESEVEDILQAVKYLSNNTEDGRLELHLIGGFIDKRRLSQKLSSQLLRAFDNQSDDIHLITLCVSELNDSEEKGIHLPIIYGIAVNVKTAEIFKASCEDRKPDDDLRSAYTFTGGTMLSIYDAKKEQLSIGPYSWIPFPNTAFWLEQEDGQILECFSTSPQAEPPHFVAHIRSTFQFLKENPYPMKSIFADRKPRVYRKQLDGSWERVLSQGT
uniref:N-terminal asparagine amidase n=1 Tax=Leptobrachium leishanense TaxID=445787 RepID=A0A8C5QS33_9ANUR